MDIRKPKPLTIARVIRTKDLMSASIEEGERIINEFSEFYLRYAPKRLPEIKRLIREQQHDLSRDDAFFKEAGLSRSQDKSVSLTIIYAGLAAHYQRRLSIEIKPEDRSHC